MYALHSQIAKALLERISAPVEERELPDGTVITVDPLSPALLGVAVKFLKDNAIASLPQEDKNVDALAQKLKEKRQKRALRLVGEAPE
jgi:hypothetical protein